MPIAAAWLPVNPKRTAPKNATKTPNCAAAPSSRLLGLANRGPKSVIAPTPRKIKEGYINLHGHIHNKKISDDYPKNYTENKHVNLSVDVTNYKPVSLDKINKIRGKNNEIKR